MWLCVCALHFRVQGLNDARKAELETAKKYYQFLEDSEQEERWVMEKIDVVKSTNVGKDLNSTLMLVKKHEVCSDRDI